jgi:hypothetical protein
MTDTSNLESLIEQYAKQIEKLSKGTVKVYFSPEENDLEVNTIDEVGFEKLSDNVKKRILELISKVEELRARLEKIKEKESKLNKVYATTEAVASNVGGIVKKTAKATGKAFDYAYKRKGKLGFIDLSSYYRKPKTLTIVDPRSPIFDKAFQMTLYSAIGGLTIVVLIWYAFPLLYNFLLWVTLLGYNVSSDILSGAGINPPYFKSSIILRVAYILNEIRDFLFYILPLSILIGITIIIIKGLKKERIYIEKIKEEKKKNS